MFELVKQYGIKNWGKIGEVLDNRSGKQCRERWHNQLDPSINKSAWTVEEENIRVEQSNPFPSVMIDRSSSSRSRKWTKEEVGALDAM